MKRLAMLAGAIALALFTAGCAGGFTTVRTNLQTVSADILAAADKGCELYAPAAVAVASAPSATVGSYLKYGNSICDIATGKTIPGAPIDAGTAAWTGVITGVLKVYAALPPAAAPAPPATGSPPATAPPS